MVTIISKFPIIVPTYKVKKITNTIFFFIGSWVNPNSMNSVTLLFCCIIQAKWRKHWLEIINLQRKKYYEVIPSFGGQIHMLHYGWSTYQCVIPYRLYHFLLNKVELTRSLHNLFTWLLMEAMQYINNERLSDFLGIINLGDFVWEGIFLKWMSFFSLA